MWNYLNSCKSKFRQSTYHFKYYKFDPNKRVCDRSQVCNTIGLVY